MRTASDLATVPKNVAFAIVHARKSWPNAEATLRVGMAKAGETAILLTNLAKVFGERGDERSMPAR